MSDLATVAEAESLWIERALRLRRKLPLGNLLETYQTVSSAVSARALARIRDVCISNHDNARAEQQFDAKRNHLFIEIDSQIARVALAPDSHEAAELVASLSFQSTLPTEIETTKYPLSPTTRQRFLRAQYPAHFKKLFLPAVEQAKFIIENGHTWLEEYCIEQVNTEQDTLVDELYRIVRSVLRDAERSKVWLYHLSRTGGVYLFDKIGQVNAIGAARGLSPHYGVAPVETVSKLASYYAKSETTIDFKVVVPQNHSFLYDPRGGTYLGPIAISQLVLFGGRAFVVQPLVGRESGDALKGASWLTATYAPEIRHFVEPRLNSVRNTLKERLLQGSKLQERIARRMKYVPDDYKRSFRETLIREAINQAPKAFEQGVRAMQRFAEMYHGQ